MEKQLKDMCNISDKVLIKLQSDIAEIKVALLGNEYNPSGGLLCRTTELEKEVVFLKEQLRKYQDRFNKIVWTGIGIGTAAGVIWTFVIQLIDQILKLRG